MLPPEKSASELLQEHKKAMSVTTPLQRRPQLARGMGGDGVIDLSDRRGLVAAKPATKASLAKVCVYGVVRVPFPALGMGLEMRLYWMSGEWAQGFIQTRKLLDPPT